MASSVLDTRSFATNVYTGQVVVAEKGLFGGIAVGQTIAGSSGFEASLPSLGLSLIRWPGGTLSEGSHVTPAGVIRLGTSPDFPQTYALDYPELFHPDALQPDRDGIARAGLSEMLDMAIRTGADFSMILPTERYAADPLRAYADVTAFLQRMFVEGAYNAGVLPEHVILEIGNENYDPATYGLVAVEILRAVRDFRATRPEAEFDLAIQAMQTGNETRELVAALNDPLRGPAYANLLAEADAVRLHKLNQSLTSIAAIEDGSPSYWAVLRMTQAVEAARLALGETVLRGDVDLYVSAWTVNSNDVEVGLVSGLPAAAAMLSLFTGLMQMGADHAAVWGIANTVALSTTLSSVDRSTGITSYTPVAAMFEQMSEVLPGMTLLATPDLDANRSVDFHQFAFVDDSKLVVFLSANDISDAGLPVTLDLANFGGIGGAWAENITTPGGIAGEAVVGNPAVTWTANSVSVAFSQDYEVIRLVVGRVNPGSAPIEMRGTDRAEVLAGGLGEDTLSGGLGNDTLRGGLGADTLDGGAGLDRADYSAHAERVDIDLLNGMAVSALGHTDRLIGIEDVQMSRGGGMVQGDGARNYVYGNTGADRFRGEGGNDRFWGNGGDDAFFGGAGNDLAAGGQGADLLYGGTGNDTLIGDSQNDTIYGDDGNDVILAGSGNDLMFGGAGADQFQFRNSFGQDVIADFNHASGDRINLVGLTGSLNVDTLSQVQSRMTQVGSDVLISWNTYNRILVQNTTVSAFAADDFLF